MERQRKTGIKVIFDDLRDLYISLCEKKRGCSRDCRWLLQKTILKHVKYKNMFLGHSRTDISEKYNLEEAWKIQRDIIEPFRPRPSLWSQVRVSLNLANPPPPFSLRITHKQGRT